MGKPLVKWAPEQISDILQTTDSNAFPWKKIFEFQIKFQWHECISLVSHKWYSSVEVIAWCPQVIKGQYYRPISKVRALEYRNWPRYGLRWSGWYCNPEQHELCRPLRGRAGQHNESCSGLQYQPRQRRPYKWSISILPRSQFTKSKGNLRFRLLVPLFVPIDTK